MKPLKYFGSAIILTAFLFGCVPLKQYQDLEEDNDELSEKVDDLSSSKELLEGRNEELKDLSDKLKKQVTELTADTLRKGRNMRDCREDLRDLRNEYNDLLAQLRNEAGVEDSEELLNYLQELQEDLQEREDALIETERNLEARELELEEAENELEKAQEELEKQNERLIELEDALAQKDSASNALRKAVSDALMGFDQDQLQVHIKNGKVYVSMEEKLLFGSGSYQVSNEGASAIKQVGHVLADDEDINIMIEGHTDPVPYSSGPLLDNWDLSVKRATSVTRILLENSEIEPSRVIAAGRGPHVPVTSNDDEAGRRKNRRTEIILTPKLDQVLDILDTH